MHGTCIEIKKHCEGVGQEGAEQGAGGWKGETDMKQEEMLYRVAP